MAACEFKAGDTARAEELLQQARAQAPSPLRVSYTMVTEAVRLKLPRPLKARFDQEFNAGLAAPPTAADAAELASLAATLKHAHVKYYGQKTHAKKIVGYVDKARTAAAFTEKHLEMICDALLGLDSLRTVRQYAQLGQRRFPANPRFPYLEAVSYFINKRPEEVPVWQVRPLLEKAEHLARALPPDEQRQKLLEDIQGRLQALAALNPFAMGFVPGFFGDLFGDEEEDEDEDDYY
jgi:hypothetical protein